MATKKTTDNHFCSAVNPYAIGSIVAGKKINWDKEQDPEKKLAEILGLKNSKAIFGSNSPILFPRTLKYNSSTGRVEANAVAEDIERLNLFYKKNAVKADAKSVRKKASLVKKDGFDVSKLRALLYPNEKKINVNKNVSLDKSSSSKSSNTGSLWKVMGSYIVDKMIGEEVKQGYLGDCYFLAALCSVQWSASHLLGWSKLSNDNYKFRFWTKKLKAEWVTVSQQVEVDMLTGGWLYGHSTTNNETWPAIWEKAFAKWMEGTSSDFPNMMEIDGGCGGEALRRLTGYNYDDYYCRSGNSDKIWKMLLLRTNASGKTVSPVVVNTSGVDRQDSVGTIPHHVYSVLGIEEYNGVKYIIVRNPWASSHVKQYCRSGKWNGLELNKLGVFSMRFDKFLEYFLYIYYI